MHPGVESSIRLKCCEFINELIIVYLYTECQNFHNYLCVIFYLPFPFFSVSLLHVVKSLLSHSSYFLYPRISRCSFPSSSSSRWTPFQFVFKVAFLYSFFAHDHTSLTICRPILCIYNINFSLIPSK